MRWFTDAAGPVDMWNNMGGGGCYMRVCLLRVYYKKKKKEMIDDVCNKLDFVECDVVAYDTTNDRIIRRVNGFTEVMLA